jgi:dUTP pyrophosphatase
MNTNKPGIVYIQTKVGDYEAELYYNKWTAEIEDFYFQDFDENETPRAYLLRHKQQIEDAVLGKGLVDDMSETDWVICKHQYKPKIATRRSIGLDIFTPISVLVEPGKVTKIPTGLFLNIPKELDIPGYVQVLPTSKNGSLGIVVLAGVIDLDYKEEIHVLLTSVTGPITIAPGAKIAQLALISAYQLGEPLDVERTGGFGSTDK